MGYHLNALANLPIDGDVNFYVFVINGQYQEPLYEIVQRNFTNIARSIGSNAVIAQGLDPCHFTDEVAERYLGRGSRDYFQFLPALLITNAHPEQVTKDTIRLFVPLREAEERFGGWPQFFKMLADFVQGTSGEFIDKFRQKEDWFKDANNIVEMKPGLFGFAVNLNALATWAAKRSECARRPPYAR
jgi:hypothetical protein